MRFIALSVLCLLLMPLHAMAQALELPGSAEGSRVEERVPALPDVKVDKPEADETLDIPKTVKDEKSGFILRSLEIAGNTVIDDKALSPIYTPYFGHRVNLSTLEKIAQNITKHYRKEGYFLSQALVPVQETSKGHAKIVVVEGYVSDITVEDHTGRRDLFHIIASAKRNILAMRPIQAAALEEQLLRLDDLAAIHSKSVLTPLPKESAKPGAVGMTLILKKQKTSGSIAANNFGSRYTGPHQTVASLRVSPGLLGYDTLTLSGLTSLPTKEVHYVSTEYAVPINASGTIVALNVGYSNSVPGYTLTSNDIQSDSYMASLRVTHPMIRTRAKNLWIHGAFDMRDIDTDTLGVELYRDRVRAVRLGAQFDLYDQWRGVNYGSITLSHGLDAFGARSTGAFNLSRAEAKSDFTKAEGTYSRTQYVNKAWQIYGAASGQYAWDPLFSSEEFGFGGQPFGRAYDPSEIIGDVGWAALFELRYMTLGSWETLTLQPFGFYDIGQVWDHDTTSNGKRSAASTGVGLRLMHENGVNGLISLAFPLTKDADVPLYGNNGKNPRIGVEIGYEF